jgi:methyl-accepting chemotaxis protein
MNKIFSSLRGRLTIGVLAVMLLVMVALFLVFLQLIGNLDQRLFDTMKARALANASALMSATAFELTVGDDKSLEEARKKLDSFRKEHKNEASSISVVGKNKKIDSVVGQDVNARQLIKDPKLKDFGSGKAVVKGDLVVALVPIRADEGSSAVGTLVYVESLEDYFDARSRSVGILVAAMAMGLVLIVVVVLIIGGWTAKPIVKLVDAAERIADGDLREITVQESSMLETERLAASVKRMAEALQKQVIAIKTLIRDVSEVSREVAQAMAHLASSASQQAAAVAETASTVEEMEKAGRSAAGNAGQIVDASEKTTEASIRGRQAVDTTSGLILRIKEDSQAISAKSKALVTSVEEIGNIIGSVNAIAEQSKILAVNASIEAAKAGEYGVGFAVVAQEVKDLAQQSKEATLQITGTLTAIRQAIENMVSTAEHGERRTEEGVKMVANAGAIVNDLSEAIRENSEFANIINTSVSQQTLGLTQIASAIEQINVSAMENQEISRKIEESTRQMTDSMDRLIGLVGQWKTPDNNRPSKL